MAAVDHFPELLLSLQRREHEMWRLTREWVEVNSFTENIAGVNRVGELLKDAFAFPSVELEVKKSDRVGNHLVWRTQAARQEGVSPIVLVGHHDTVFPPGHFEGWCEEGGRAFGPGALDMKGGLAIVRTVLSVLDEANLLADLPVLVISVADEEIGSPDSAPVLREVAKGAQCALVFESGRAGDLIVTRRRGTGLIRACATGRAAHAGNAHEEGRNAIWAVAKLIDAVQPLTDYGRGVTVNVGVVRGGTSKNTVPESASCEIDLRFNSTDDAKALVDAIHLAAQRAEQGVSGTRIRLEGGITRPPLEKTKEQAALFSEYAACQRAATLGDGEAPLVGGGSDANTVAAIGVPAIDGLGPRGAGFHTTTEYVELASFLPKAEALLRFLAGRLRFQWNVVGGREIQA
ncbi:MAG: M20 family metallopeptidase [Deltaproteobacteria bacterium]|nr:M20 family metallopeptidase [Deltaproteobacteria bacterium]